MATLFLHRHLALTVFAIAIILLLVANNGVQGQAIDCSPTDGLSVLVGCQNYILKGGAQQPPSQDCCKVVKFEGLKCTCKLINDFESVISTEKLLQVAQLCGADSLPQGTQCGSYIVP